MLRARIAKGTKAWDDTEVREFSGATSNPNKGIGTETAFLTSKRISAKNIQVLVPSAGGRKWVPITKFVETPQFKADHKELSRGDYEVSHNAYWDLMTNTFCKTGPGGGVDPSCGKGGHGSPAPAAKKVKLGGKVKGNTPLINPLTRAEIAKSTSKRCDAEIQRYSEERNEPQLAKALGGYSLKNNEPADVVLEVKGKVRHGIELKTMVNNSNNKLTMKKKARAAKLKWERKNKATMHTVVFDDHKVFNAGGKGKHDDSKRRLFYRRGYGSFRVDKMYEVAGGLKELKKLLDTRKADLPEGAV